MRDGSFWSRLKKARLVRVLAIYLGASWIVLQVISLFVNNLGVPEWAMPAAVGLLLIGFIVVLATAWVQSHPSTESRAGAREVPGRWEVELKDVGTSLRQGKMPHLTWGRAAVGGTLAFALLFGFAGLYVVIHDRGRSFAPEPAVAGEAAPGVAVLPFEVQGKGLDRQVWREGMVSLLSFGIDGAAGLRAIDSRTLLARWHREVPEDAVADLPTALGVAREVGAKHAVVGSAVAVGSGVRLVAEVYDVKSGKSLGQSQVEGSPDSVQSLVDRLAGQVLQTLLGKQARALNVDLARSTTTSLPALKAYLDGEAAYRRSNFADAVNAFERAVDLDSTFALAQARLASAAGWESAGNPKTAQHLPLALRYAERLPDRERRLLWAWDQAFDQHNLEAVDSLKRLTEEFPDDAEAWYEYGDAHVHLDVSRDVAEREKMFRQAIDLDPGFAPYWIHYMEGQFYLHPDDSAAVAKEVARFESTANPGPVLRRKFGDALAIAFGDSATRAATLAALDTTDFSVVRRIIPVLAHPRFWNDREAVLRALARHPKAEAKQFAANVLYDQALDEGRFGTALERAGDPEVSPGNICFGLFRAGFLGELPPDVKIGPLVEHAAARLGPFGPVCRTLHAMNRKDWPAVDAGLDSVRARAAQALAGGDSSLAAGMDTARSVLSALVTWKKKDDPSGALREMEALGAGRPGGAPPFILGALYLELGRYRDAESQLERGGSYAAPGVRLLLARARDQLGLRARALEDYRYVVQAWRDADPSLQPKVREAEQRIAALEKTTS